MAEPTEDNLKFVCLIEELKDILEKSQVPSAKKKKEEAAAIFIEKWKECSGKELSQPSLLKKITNLKVRAKSALNKGVKLSDWQSKILEITKEDVSEPQSDRAEGSKNESSASTDAEETITVKERLNLLNKFETEETRSLTNEQLQRIVLLQKIQIQKQQLENGPFLVDIGGFNVSNILNTDDQ